MIDNFYQRHDWCKDNLFYKCRFLTKGCRQLIYGHYYEGSSLMIVYDRSQRLVVNKGSSLTNVKDR